MKHKSAWGCLFFLALYLGLPSLVRAGAPTEQLRATVDGVLAVLGNTGLKGKTGERREQLRRLIYPRFDFAEMAKRSLGPHWQRRTPQEQQEFVKAFTELLEKSYVDRIESYHGEKVAYGNEILDQSYAEVGTKIVTKKGEEFSVNYRLHLVGGEWRVYDVIIENISLVSNYRSQFNRILATASYDELMRRIKEKQVAPPEKGKEGRRASLQRGVQQ